MTVTPTIERVAYTWESQAKQFARGKPGMTYERHYVQNYPVDSLVYRNRKGVIIGVLYYYPEGSYEQQLMGEFEWEKPGAFNVLVAPRRQRRGIGMLLLREAMKRWDIDFTRQNYTPSGAALVNRYLKERDSENYTHH